VNAALYFRKDRDLVNRRSKIILILGFLATAGYGFIFYSAASPIDSLIVFLKTAPFNERGDFLAGLFGPITFLWLIIGYLLQAEIISASREQIYSQSELILYQLEMQNRVYDPVFTLEVDANRICHISNVGQEYARQLMVYYVDHKNQKLFIIAMANALGGSAALQVDLQPPLRLPLKVESELPFELMLVYNTRVNELRAQRFYLIEADQGIIGWQVETAGSLPSYFSAYNKKI
jgi:hypothetical protein